MLKEDSKREEMKSEQTVTPFTAAVNGGLAGAIYGGIAGMIIPPLFRRLYRGLAPLSEAVGEECKRVTIKVDNKSAIALTKNLVFHGRK